jgi:hypothetical protein
MPTTIQTDLFAPLEIWEVPLDDGVIKFYQPLLLKPQPMPDDPEEPCLSGKTGYGLIEQNDLNLSVFAHSREELEYAVFSEIRFIWKHFVQTDDAKLNTESQKIKERYLALAEKIYG